MADEWDLSQILTERKQPKTEVTIYLSEELSYAKAQLMESSKDVKDEDLDKLTAKIEEIDAALEEAKYVVHITGVPSRLRDDLSSKALAKFPVKPQWSGLDDPSNAQERIKHENALIWNAQITAVDNPHGQTKTTWTLPEIEKFTEQLPHSARNAISQAISDLTAKSEQYSVKAKDIDFL